MDFKSKIYIAGHTGLVGSALMRALNKQGYDNLITRDFSELNLIDQNEVKNFFNTEKPEYVLLAAAKVGGIQANNTYKADFIYQNIMIAANVINASYESGVKKLLNLGSSCIYPKLAPQPLTENYLLTGELEKTNEPYAVAKISAIKMCRYYNEQYSTDFMSVMPTNLYGPNDNFNLETGHVLPVLIRKFHLAKLLSENDFTSIIADIKKYRLGSGLDDVIDLNDNGSIEKVLNTIGLYRDKAVLWGTGSPYREFLYVDDLAEACVFLMTNYTASEIGEFINIGSGVDQTIKHLAEIIKRLTGFNGAIEFDSTKPDGTPKKLLDVSRINSFGWKNKIKIDEGTALLYNWYLAR